MKSHRFAYCAKRLLGPKNTPAVQHRVCQLIFSLCRNHLNPTYGTSNVGPCKPADQQIIAATIATVRPACTRPLYYFSGAALNLISSAEVRGSARYPPSLMSS